METVNLLEATNSVFPELSYVAEFYDRALCAALANPRMTYADEPAAALKQAVALARIATQDRFGVRLILPGDTEGR